MITVTNSSLHGIPYLEVVEKERTLENLPVVVFYHGWTSSKESVLVHGYELAKKGIRAILPDALHHGERGKEMNLLEGAVQFWPIVFKSIQELPLFREHFNRHEENVRISVGGLSMGGMTTSAILATYPWVETASILMGSVDPAGFTNWLLHSKAVAEITQNLKLFTDEQLAALYTQLEPISLKNNVEKINGRPLYMWHATGDQVVPFLPIFDFYERFKKNNPSAHMYFEVTEGGSHHVPYTAIQNQATFFATHFVDK